MARRPAPAKINLSLVVGPRGDDGKHEVATVLQRVALADRIAVEAAPAFRVSGFAADTLVRQALEALASAAGVEPGWDVRITKRIPVGAGLGGGSSDAATALRLANATLEKSLPDDELVALARTIGADVPFFLRNGPQLGTAEGGELEPLDLPQDYWVLLLLPSGAAKQSTAAVYSEFDRREGAGGYERRLAVLSEALARVRRPLDLAALPRNDLAGGQQTNMAAELESLGAFRADLSGAGPAVYGLFTRRAAAVAARRRLASRGRTWLTVPAWYG